MGDIPSARELALYDLRRMRASRAATVVLAAAIVGALLSGRPEIFPLAGAAFLAYFAVPAWIGVGPVYPTPSLLAGIAQQIASFGLPMVGVLLVYVVLTKGALDIVSMAPGLIAGALVYSAYQWRYTQEAQRRIRGESAAMPLIGRLWRHYLGYVIGIGAALVATSFVDVVAVVPAMSTFAAAFLVGKAAVDLSLPQPPLGATRVSAALLQLTLISPIWFGVPWGAGYLAFEAVMGRDVASLLEPTAYVSTLVESALACTIVFAAIAVVAAVIEFATGGRD